MPEKQFTERKYSHHWHTCMHCVEFQEVIMPQLRLNFCSLKQSGSSYCCHCCLHSYDVHLCIQRVCGKLSHSLLLLYLCMQLFHLYTHRMSRSTLVYHTAHCIQCAVRRGSNIVVVNGHYMFLVIWHIENDC